MIWPDPTNGFSPYRDPEPINEFYDDFSRRGMTSIIATVVVHVFLILVLAPTFVFPEFEEEEPPETISIDIISFEDLQPEPAPEPEPVPAPIKPPAPAVTPQAAPEPVPAPPPPPPPPPPLPKPEPIPEPVIDPIPEPEPQIIIPPEILTQEVIEPIEPEFIEPIPDPIQQVEPEPFIPPEPIFEPEPIPEPVLEPIYESEPIIEPVIEYEPIIEPALEPVYEPLPEVVFEPAIEPFLEFEPVIPEAEIIQDPLLEPRPDITEPLPGTLDPVLEPYEPEVIPEPIQEDIVEIEPITPEPPTPEVIEPEIIEPVQDLPIITTAPTVLASPDAPTSIDELERAVPQSQADQMLDPLQRPIGGGGNPIISGPTYGGGATPPSGGTRRATPGAGGGWTLDPSSLGGGQSEGWGEGISLDMRCREEDRTHQDCPEYINKFEGRNAAGFETFGAHSTSGIQSTTRARAGRPVQQVIGGSNDIWSGAAIGDNSVNGGNPGTSILDEADFGRLGTPDQPRLSDIFKEPDKPKTGLGNLILPPPDKE